MAEKTGICEESILSIGQDMYDFAGRLFPIGRSLTGEGVRKTLRMIREQVPELEIKSVPSGTMAFDWTVPQEWEIREGYIEDEEGHRIVDYHENNLCVMGYSTPVDRYVSREELMEYVKVEEGQPDAIPYVTSYYAPRFAFCMSKNRRDSLKPGIYHMVIDSRHFDGVLNYGEILLPGESSKEILLSTYVCHPSMANNEVSGPVLVTWLAKWLKNRKRRYSYRIVFVPETIGSIVYISRNLKELKKNIVAGFVLTCVGDDREYSYLESRKGNTLTDRVMKNVLGFAHPEYKSYSYLDRGSDERQYNAPGVDLPVCDFCRSKYGEYPEYHTSEDNMSLISPEGLAGSYDVMTQILQALEYNRFYRVNCFCEPQLGKRGLYPTVSRKGIYDEVKKMTNLIAYSDGTEDLISVSTRIGVPVKELVPVVNTLTEAGLLMAVDE
ncbi:MAG: DUF4910 domain-containing protein [Lachnospiraceae bacterium]|nr:DUF4910 domain-containing protein [Lachnospiraceae bacterium]